MRIGLLTGGGDCPGLNAAIRAVVRTAAGFGHEVIGVREGWDGLLKGKFFPLTVQDTTGLLPLGGTILGCSRVNPLRVRNGLSSSLSHFRKKRLRALVAIGGEGTLKIAAEFVKRKMPIVMIPKTIDNDTWGTDYSIGFDTAVHVATAAIDRLHTTAEAHQRVMIVEVMGRHAGWIAAYAGIAGGADAILTPERTTDIRDLVAIIGKRNRRRRRFSIFVVAEDAKILLDGKQILRTALRRDEYGDVQLGGIGELLAGQIRRRINAEVRVTVLGYVQRGGTPTAFDRILATRLGVKAVELVLGRRFGLMAVLRGNRIRTVPIRTAAGRLKRVDPDIARVGSVFFS